jgi:exonuclease SbcD
MKSEAVRILFLADTHLGLDMPVRPRVERRRRGPDFFRNYEQTLAAAARQGVDLIVHGGDLLFRHKVPMQLVQRAMIPLKRVADAGIPVYLVPGNHERSEIPFEMLALHPRIHIFDRPRTYVARLDGIAVALSGFPFCRDGVRERFPTLVQETGMHDTDANVRLICVHQCFEGAVVGPHDYTFRYTSDVVRTSDVPTQCAAVLSGHIHRHQVLTKDLRGRELPTPVFYPGSIERTSFAEKDEPKGYLVLDIGVGDVPGGVLKDWEFHHLPARPMHVVELRAGSAKLPDLESAVRAAIASVPKDAILRLKISGTLSDRDRIVFSAASLRALAPRTMNVDCRVPAPSSDVES